MTKKEVLKKSNHLISVLPRESISSIQQKSYNVFLKVAQEKARFSKKEKFINVSKENNYIFKISCNDLKERAGLNKQDYNYIKQELEKLMEIVIEVVDKENKDNWALFHFLDEVEKKDNEFEFVLNWRIVKSIKKCDFFTRLDLGQIAKLNSKYSIILYELAQRYLDEKNPNITIPKMTIEELRKRTNTEDKYKRFEAFRRRVLDRACNEISEKTDILLDYKKIKKGRRIAYIDFEVKKKNNQPKIENEEEDISENSSRPSKSGQKEFSDDVEYLYKLLPKNLQNWANKRFLDNALDQHEKKYIAADIKLAKEKNDISNFIGWLKSSLKKCENAGGCGNGGHFGDYLVVIQEKAQKKKEKKKKKKIIDKLEKQAKTKSFELYNDLSEEEKTEMLEELDYNQDSPFSSSPKTFLRSHFYNKILKNLKNEYIEDFNQKQSKK